MFESIIKFFKKIGGRTEETVSSKDAAKERLHLVLMQDRANVSADFLDLMRREIIEVIKKYIDVDESEIDVRLTNKQNDDGTTGAPALYANIPIVSIKEEVRSKVNKQQNQENSNINQQEENQEKEQKEETEKIQEAQQIQQQEEEKIQEEDEQKQETEQESEQEEVVLEQKRA